MTIHWCGTGLSAIPGLRRLIQNGYDVQVWNRSTEKAQAAIGDLTTRIAAFSEAKLADQLGDGDVVVSMLPGDWHVPLAQLCLTKNAHFVSSSYIAPEMRALNEAAVTKGLRFVNEVGLDPGIDHLMAHALIADYKSDSAFEACNALHFHSYCGGIPKIPNPFRYKFSWSPVGVLKALRAPSRSLRGGVPFDVARPWHAIDNFTAPLAVPETFEVYPNRDSLPFMEEYGFKPSWNTQTFVRGTLRLNGWAEAWKDVFAEIQTLSGPEGDARLVEMSDGFWADNRYAENEPDRVVLCVDLKAERESKTVYHKTYVMDAWGDSDGTAMARLVSVPVSLAVEAVLTSKIAPGVHSAPGDLALVRHWMDIIETLAQHLQIVDHLR